jgi:hypothetical protein
MTEATHEKDMIEMPFEVAEPEAGFSLNWQMVDGFNATVQVTMRTAHVYNWPDVMKHRADFMEKAVAKGWNVPGRLPSATPPAAVATTATPTAPRPSAALAPVQPSGGKEILTLVATKMEVMPKPDGKVELKFFEQGHKFPDIYATGAVENMVKLLTPTGQWTAEMLSQATTYEGLAYTVRYTLGKLNSKGNPYKDIVNLSA